MQDSLRSKWLGCSHVPSPSSPSRNLANGGWISLNSSTSPAFTESPSVSSRIGEGEESGSQPWHCRGVLWRDRGGAFGNLPIPSYRPTAQRHSRWHRAAQREWLSAPKPDWLTEGVYVEKIQPSLASVTISAISSTLGVS